MKAGGPRIAAIALGGILIAAIIRASRNLDKQLDHAFADGDWPKLPNGMRVDGPTTKGGGGWQPSKSGRPFETHNVKFRTHDRKGG